MGASSLPVAVFSLTFVFYFDQRVYSQLPSFSSFGVVSVPSEVVIMSEMSIVIILIVGLLYFSIFTSSFYSVIEALYASADLQ